MNGEGYDLAVVGAGIIGLACAYEAAAGGRRVVLIERDQPGSGAGGVAAGMLAPASEGEAGDRHLIDLALESCERYPQWVQAIEADSGFPCGYRTEGSLLVALHHDHLAELRQLAASQARLGLAVEWRDADDLLAIEPNLSPRVVGGLAAPGDRQVDPRRLMRALVGAVQRRGGTLYRGASEIELETAAGRVTGVRFLEGTEERLVRAEVVLVAAGAWSGAFWPSEWGQLPLRPVKGQVLRLRGAPLIRHVVRTPDVYLVPREDGELIVGATSEERGFDTRVMAGAVLDLLREAWRVLPGVAELEFAEASVGFRPALRDFLPAIGPTPTEGLYFATGHYRNGVLLAPATAALLWEAMERGTLPDRLKPFDPRRLVTAPAVGGGG